MWRNATSGDRFVIFLLRLSPSSLSSPFCQHCCCFEEILGPAVSLGDHFGLTFPPCEIDDIGTAMRRQAVISRLT
jgi:hypothetical protein